MESSTRRDLDVNFVSEIIGQPVKKFTDSAGAKKGDNVIATLLALNVETEEGTELNVVVKSLLPLTGEVTAEAIGRSQFYVGLKVFPTEVAYYQKVRPLLQQVPEFTLNTPRIFSAIAGGFDDYIALEDLRPSGYKMADKRKGLRLDEVTLTLKKLAMLHAHSYALLQKRDNPEVQELTDPDSVLNGHVWQRKIAGLDQGFFYNGIIQKMTEVIREAGDPETADKMQNITKTGYQIMIDLWEKRGKSAKYFETILHGDLWTNNVLFKYASNGETIQDLTFIDFQQCRLGTIYEDLLYFLFTSTTSEFRKTNLRKCLQAYYKEFETILATLECPMPEGFTDEELIATFYENIEYGFSYDLIAIPFQLGTEQGPPQDQTEAPKGQQQPSPLDMLVMMTEVMKQGTKSSPVAVQRLKELCGEMVKLNIL